MPEGCGARVVSAYDTLMREARAKVRGLSGTHGSLQRLGFRAELLWTRLVLDPPERRGYRDSCLVLVNYESVRRLLAAAIGRLITDPALRQKLGRSARATFEARFSAATFVDALRKTYAELGVTPL